MNQNPFYKIFTWFAGVDRTILNTCNNSEKIKHTGIGMLLLIPMTLSGISMSFAINAMTNNLSISVALGVVWAFFILIIDRYLVSSMVKKEKRNAILSTPTIWIRLLFAAILGVTVSHPLVLFLLNPSIEHYTSKYDDQEIDSIQVQDSTKNSYNIIKLDSLLNARSKQYGIVLQFGSLLSKEANGVFSQDTIDGYPYQTSGRRNVNQRGGHNTVRFEGDQKIAKEQLQKIDDEIKRLKTDVDRVGRLDSQNLQKIQSTQNNDYLTRAITLSRMRHEPDIGPTVRNMQLILMFIFWLIDIIPVLFKLLAKYGEYDQKINEADLLNRNLARIQYEMNRELGRISLEEKYRYKRKNILYYPADNIKSAKDLDDHLDDLSSLT
jgi:Domain of unknown function (DUF4407)